MHHRFINNHLPEIRVQSLFSMHSTSDAVCRRGSSSDGEEGEPKISVSRQYWFSNLEGCCSCAVDSLSLSLSLGDTLSARPVILLSRMIKYIIIQTLPTRNNDWHVQFSRTNIFEGEVCCALSIGPVHAMPQQWTSQKAVVLITPILSLLHS